MPVAFHMWANCTWARLPMRAATNPAVGMTMRLTTASSGDTQNIMMSTPMTVRMALSSCCMVWVRVWATLSMSLVIRLMSSPRGCLSK